MSAMTEIRDRLQASGDEEAATALDVAMRAASDRLEALEEARGRIGELESAVAGKVKLFDPTPEAIAWAEGIFAAEDAKDARIAELEAAIAAITKSTQAYLPPDGISAKDCISQILEVLDKLDGKSDE